MRTFINNFINRYFRIRSYLITANVLVVLFLILFSNYSVLPLKSTGDFIFFSVLFLIFALYRPGWSFLFFVGTIVLENINIAPESLGIAIRPFQFFGALTILAVMIRWAIGKLNFKLARLSWPDYAVAIFVISSFVSSILSVDKAESLKQSIVLLSFALLYFLVRTYVQSLEDLKKIIPFFLSSSVVVVLYGIWQNFQFMRGGNSFEAMPGRPNSTFAEADWLGIFLVFLSAVVYALLYCIQKSDSYAESESRGINIKLFLIWIFLLFIYTLLIITVSRSAWLGALAITALFLIIILTNFSVKISNWQWKEFAKNLALIVIIFAVSILSVKSFNLTSFELLNRVQSAGTGLQEITVSCDGDMYSPPGTIKDTEELSQYECRHINLEEIESERDKGKLVTTVYREDPNVNIRSEIYSKSWNEIKKHPVLGIGWGSISRIFGADQLGNNLNSSNIFLEVWLGSGIIGLVALVIILAYILFRSIVDIRRDNDLKLYGIFLVLALTSLIIPNLFNAGIFLGILWLFIGSSVHREEAT